MIGGSFMMLTLACRQTFANCTSPSSTVELFCGFDFSLDAASGMGIGLITLDCEPLTIEPKFDFVMLLLRTNWDMCLGLCIAILLRWLAGYSKTIS